MIASSLYTSFTFGRTDIWWKGGCCETSISGGWQGWRFDTGIGRASWCGSQMDLLLLTNKEGLVEDMVINGSLGCKDRAIAESKILGAMRTEGGRVQSLGLGRVSFDWLRKLMVRSHEQQLWRANMPGKSGRFLRTVSSKHKSVHPNTQKNKLMYWLSRELMAEGQSTDVPLVST